MARKIRIIAVGKIKDKNILSLIKEFIKRTKPFANLTLTELKEQGLKKANLINSLGPSTFILDERGKMFSSIEFAELIKKTDAELTFIIGGPEGITDETKSKARLISLSKMTFTHEMSRLFLIEQIYRACMINNNRGYYHK